MAGWWGARDLHKGHILYLKYEDMRKDLAGSVCRVATFLDKELADDVLQRIVNFSSFDQMKANPKTNKTDMPHMRNDIVPFLRKGQVGDWRNYFTSEQNKYIDELYELKCTSRGLSFDFE